MFRPEQARGCARAAAAVAADEGVEPCTTMHARAFMPRLPKEGRSCKAVGPVRGSRNDAKGAPARRGILFRISFRLFQKYEFQK